ncbi:hypothetical protein STIB_47310 [Streptomyces sp. IB2014 011-1]|nr:hypothetical protein STIB_47310 [Streptomyces sp. IB2014 011-1]
MVKCPLLGHGWRVHPGAVSRDLEIGAKVFLPHSQWMENMQVK